MPTNPHLADLRQEEIRVQDRVSDQYDQVRYRRDYSLAYHRLLTQRMLALINRDARLVLDNGCGTGLLSAVSSGCTVIGLDISLGMLRRAQARNRFLICANAEELPFKDGTFEAVICRGLLHHLARPQEAVVQLARVLKKDGQVVFMETNRSFFNDLPRRLLKKTEHFSGLHQNFRRAELLRLLETEFVIEQVVHFGFLAYPLIGFPDMLDVFRFFAGKKFLAALLTSLDDALGKIPLVQRQSWGIMVQCRRRH